MSKRNKATIAFNQAVTIPTDESMIFTISRTNNIGVAHFIAINAADGASTDIDATVALGTVTKMPVAGTFSKLYIDGTGIVATMDNTITIFKNGVATALVATIATGQQVASDITHSFTCAAGDLISAKYAAGTDYGPLAIGLNFTP